MMGYYLNYFALPKERRRLQWPIINSLILLAAIVTGVYLAATFRVPEDIAQTFTILFVEIFGLLIIVITGVETRWVVNAKDPNSGNFKRLGWDQLIGRPRRTVLLTFLFFNYQEMSIAILYVVISLLGRFLV